QQQRVEVFALRQLQGVPAARDLDHAELVVDAELLLQNTTEVLVVVCEQDLAHYHRRHGYLSSGRVPSGATASKEHLGTSVRCTSIQGAGHHAARPAGPG